MAPGPPGDEQEESLSTGLQRQLDNFSDVQQQMANFASDLSRLKIQCDALKQERTSLLRDVASRESDRSSLDREIERLKSERDSLQIEYAALCEDEQYLRQAEAMAATMEIESTGRMARRLWLSGEEIKQLQQQLDEAEGVRQADIEAERQIAAGLRLRIQRLERKVRETSQEAAKSPDLEAEHQIAVLKDDNARLHRDNEDARSALAVETRNLAVATKQAERLAEELQWARSAAEHRKTEAVELQQRFENTRAELEKSSKAIVMVEGLQLENEKLKRQLQARTESPASTPPVLQQISTNIPTPRTPTKFSHPATFDTPKHSVLSPNASVAKQYAHLEKQHIALKAAFDRLRTKYQNDLKHWKEYRAVDLARKEARQRRRDERRSTAAPVVEQNQSDASRSSTDPPSLARETPKPISNEAGNQLLKRTSFDSDQDERSQKRSKPNTPDAEGVSEQAVAGDSTSDRLAPSASHRTPARLPTTSIYATPSLSRQPSRVTPWLGAKGSGSKHAAQFDAFGSDGEESATTPVRVRNPLVRDRTGDTSLRRSTLVRVATADVDSPVAGPSTPGSTSKRPLDFEHLTPAERAAERKRLSRLPTSERRQLYAAYKGKGRYIAPDDLKQGVADEFEVDPSRNGGITHQYHEVVRGREERRKMHGGDCECCRDYYASVGELPRFNQAPAWRDNPTSPDKGQVDLEDHQNRISRHRETWRKPPTPPDYWKIGFPTTQDVLEVNAKADDMAAKREAEIRREAAHKDSKWRKRA